MSRNRAKCKNCGDIVESKSRHDFVSCSCFQMGLDHGFFLDGGQEYDSRYGGNITDIEWMTEDTVADQVQKIY